MRLIHTEPLSKVLARQAEHDQHAYDVSHAHVTLIKTGGDAETTHALSGELYGSNSGWILLDVPNAIVRGAFDALNESGVELPLRSNGSLNAHISVMRPEELAKIGGIDKITERGHHFHYTLGPIQSTEPDGWGEMSKVWFIQVKSKELQDLRKSYGLSPRPNDDKYDFHITIAVRRKSVLRNNDISKAKEASILSPVLGAGRVAMELAGARALTHRPPLEDTLATEIMLDNSHLSDLTPAPVVMRPKKRKKTIPPAVIASLINPALAQGEPNGLLQQKIATTGTIESNGPAPSAPAGASSSFTEPASFGLSVLRPGPETANDYGHTDTDFRCADSDLERIYAHYDGATKLATRATVVPKLLALALIA